MTWIRMFSKMGGFFTLLACPLIALAQGGDYSAKQSIIQGIDRFERGETGSDSLFAQGESHSTLSAVASYNRGRALMESAEKGAEARQAFQKSLKGNDDTRMQSDAWHNIGNSLLMEQDPENAIEAYKAALRANPQNEAARYNLSYALRMLNDEQEQNEQEQNEQEQQARESKSKTSKSSKARESKSKTSKISKARESKSKTSKSSKARESKSKTSKSSKARESKSKTNKSSKARESSQLHQNKLKVRFQKKIWSVYWRALSEVKKKSKPN